MQRRQRLLRLLPPPQHHLRRPLLRRARLTSPRRQIRRTPLHALGPTRPLPPLA